MTRAEVPPAVLPEENIFFAYAPIGRDLIAPLDAGENEKTQKRLRRFPISSSCSARKTRPFLIIGMTTRCCQNGKCRCRNLSRIRKFSKATSVFIARRAFGRSPALPAVSARNIKVSMARSRKFHFPFEADKNAVGSTSG